MGNWDISPYNIIDLGCDGITDEMLLVSSFLSKIWMGAVKSRALAGVPHVRRTAMMVWCVVSRILSLCALTLKGRASSTFLGIKQLAHVNEIWLTRKLESEKSNRECSDCSNLSRFQHGEPKENTNKEAAPNNFLIHHLDQENRSKVDSQHPNWFW